MPPTKTKKPIVSRDLLDKAQNILDPGARIRNFVDPTIPTGQPQPQPLAQPLPAQPTRPSPPRVPEVPQVNPQDKPVEVFRDNATGEKSGFTDPNSGRTFLGLTPEQVDEFINRRNKKIDLPQGAAEVGAEANRLKAVEDQKVAAQLIQQIGNVPTLPSGVNGDSTTGFGDALQGAAPDILTSIGQNALGGLAAGALAGAAGGTVALPGLGTAAGAVGLGALGAVGGAARGALTIIPQLKEEFQQQREVSFADYKTSVTNIKAIIDGVNKGLVDPVEAVDLYNFELAKIDRAERDLRLLDEKDWLSKAKKRLTQIQAFNDVQRQNTAQLLANAIAKPNPSANFELPQSLTSSEVQDTPNE